jgi:hypothetical protein
MDGAGGMTSIPSELRDRSQWVVWRYEQRDGKQTKVPYRPVAGSMLMASTTDPGTWGTFDAATALAERFDGFGFVFSADDPFAGVDLDHCRDPETGQLEDEAAAWTLRLDSYTETSPSGTGVHVLLRAAIPGDRRRNGKIEMYDRGRYFCMTGEHVQGLPTTINDRQGPVEALYAEVFPEEPAAGVTSTGMPSPIGDDRDLVDRAMLARDGAKFRDLWEGNWTGYYSSQSEADLALCGLLRFWAGQDPHRVDALFRQSGLMRPKWDSQRGESTYGQDTINRALPGDVFASSRNVTPTLELLKTPLLEPRGVPSDFPGKCVLGDVLAAFDELLLLPDHGPPIVAMAGVVANYATGDVVWPLLVGPPGCGKSEIITALAETPGVWSLSSLTPQTLLSGFERKGKAAANAPAASMLLQIGSFGILAFKDLTTVLTMHREARAQIIGQLREVADGKTEKNFGNGLRIEWEGKLGLLAGVTPVIDEQHAFLSVMGERFLLYRMPEVPRAEITRRALTRRGVEPELRARIRTVVAGFLSQFRDVGRLDLPDVYTEPLIALADMVTRARSGVARDYHTRDMLYLPEPEAPTRLAKQIAQLMAAMLVIGVDARTAWQLARKIGWDSVPAARYQVIALLAHDGGTVTTTTLQEQTGLPATTINRVVEDLVALDLIDRRKEGNRWEIRQSAEAAAYWDAQPERDAAGAS